LPQRTYRLSDVMPDAASPGRALTPSLLATKLFTSALPHEHVGRPRLVALLQDAQRRRATLVSAPAGFGKSTLLASWAAAARQASADCTFAWLALDDADNDPVRFWTYVVAVLHQAAGIGGALLAALQSPHPPPADALLTDLINALAAHPESLLLVLDDLHLIEAPDIYRALTFLVDHLPPNVHLVLAGRADPPLPLARWRARGYLGEVRADDLRFTQAEAAALLTERMRLPLSSDDVARLEARTEGWAAGLQLAALALRDRADAGAFLDAFTGSHRYVLAYLVDDVFEQQPTEVQHFLLHTSVLERLCADLCDALLRDEAGAPTIHRRAQELLEQLERANLFLVPLDDTNTWYRYHHLFAEVLRHRLQRLAPSLPSTLHHRASAWYEAHGQLPEAVQHALSAGDRGLAARLLDADVDRMLDRGELATLLRLAEAVGADDLSTYRHLGVYHAYTLVRVGRYAAAEEQIRRVERALAIGPVQDETAQLFQGIVATIRATLASIHGETGRAESFATKALALLPGDQLMWRGVTMAQLGGLYGLDGRLAEAEQALAVAAAHSTQAGDTYYQLIIAWRQGRLLLTRGRLHAAAERFRAVQREAEARGVSHLPASGYAALSLAEILREWDDLEVAEATVRAGIAQLSRAGSATILLDGFLCASRIAAARGDHTGAVQAIAEAEALVREQSLPQRFHSRLAAGAARVTLAAGELDAAERWAARWSLEADEAISDEGMGVQIAQVRLLLAQGDQERVRERLELLTTTAADAGWGWRQVELAVLSASAWLASGDRDHARAALITALGLGAAEGYTRVFLDEGPLLLALLPELHYSAPSLVDRLLNSAANERVPVHASAPQPGLPAISTREAEAPNATLDEPLTERELEVLTLVAQGLSNQAIAEQLIVSIGTVKKHVEHIHGKLGVSSRTAAVARARAIGLIT
jgi:LuxR family transcriptional regulator, maltose regulon positive regulatory protein